MTNPINNDNLSEEDKIIEAQLAEMRAAQVELERKIREMSARQNEIQRIRKESAPIVGTARYNDTTKLVTLKLSESRPDITEFLRTLSSRVYDWNSSENRMNIPDFGKLEDWAKTRQGIEIKMDDISRQKVEKEKNAPNVDIWDDGRVIKIKLRGVSSWFLTHHLKNASVVAGKLDQYAINRSDAYQLIGFIDACRVSNLKVEIIPDVLKYAEEQEKSRHVLKELAIATDAEYDVEIACGYKLEPLQRVAAKFIEQAKKVIIADPMGMGKSLESIAPAIKNDWRTLIICPAFLVDNWTNYIREYTGQVPYIMEGTVPEQYVMIDLMVNKKQYNIINYESLARPIKLDDPDNKFEKIERNLWVDMLNASGFDYIISDESHYIKNIDSARTKAVMAIKGEREAFLTGTPLLNRPKELFPMLTTLYPNEFPSQKAFEKAYCDGANGAKNVEHLRDILANIMIRRKNPRVTVINPIPVYLRLSPEAQKRYDKVLAGIYETITGGRYEIPNVLVELMRLKQICADDTVPNTVEQAIEVKDSYDPDEKHNGVLIFSQFVDSAFTIKADLESEGCTVGLIYGDIGMSDRTSIVKQFQDGELDFLVGTTAMGEGLNITRAGTVLFNDLLWNKAKHDQFSGRAFGRTSDHHGGNEYWMLKQKTIIDDIYSLIGSKDFTAKQVVDGEFMDDRAEQSVVNAIIRKIRES